MSDSSTALRPSISSRYRLAAAVEVFESENSDAASLRVLLDGIVKECEVIGPSRKAAAWGCAAMIFASRPFGEGDGAASVIRLESLNLRVRFVGFALHKYKLGCLSVFSVVHASRRS